MDLWLDVEGCCSRCPTAVAATLTAQTAAKARRPKKRLLGGPVLRGRAQQHGNRRRWMGRDAVLCKVE